jgi:glycosyltransferase involved in cell wall biosynthesis
MLNLLRMRRFVSMRFIDAIEVFPGELNASSFPAKIMKILIVHNRYRQLGGEDVVFQQEQALLGQTEDVKILTFQNQAGWRGAVQFLMSIWNVLSSQKLRQALITYRPDVVHVHNCHYALGPLCIRTIKKLGVPMVFTLHNFRLLCPSAIFLHNGQLFTDSINAYFPWKAVRNKVYHQSHLQTFWTGFVTWFHRRIGTWPMVDRYIVLTDFTKQIFVNSSLGVPSEKFVVKSNFTNRPPVAKSRPRKPHFLYLGRISEEKGIRDLLVAFRDCPYDLRVAGDGPLMGEVEAASRQNPRIKALGRLDREQAELELLSCSAVVLPSIWYEGMPMVTLEAFALGTPILASNIGALASVVRHGHNGFHFEPGDPLSLRQQLDRWAKLPDADKAVLGANALADFERLYSPEKNREALLGIYRQVINHSNQNKHQMALSVAMSDEVEQLVR